MLEISGLQESAPWPVWRERHADLLEIDSGKPDHQPSSALPFGCRFSSCTSSFFILVSMGCAVSREGGGFTGRFCRKSIILVSRGLHEHCSMRREKCTSPWHFAASASKLVGVAEPPTVSTRTLDHDLCFTKVLVSYLYVLLKCLSPTCMFALGSGWPQWQLQH